MAETDLSETTLQTKLNPRVANALLIYKSGRLGVETLIQAAIETTTSSAHSELYKACQRTVGSVAQRATQSAKQVCEVNDAQIKATIQQDMAVDFSCDQPPETCCKYGLKAAIAILKHEGTQAVFALSTNPLKNL